MITPEASWELARPPVPCWLCGDLLHLIADEGTDEFEYEDEAGHRTGTDSDLRHLVAAYGSADARLALLRDRMDAAMKACGGPRGTRASLTPLYWAAAREYSALKVRLDSGGTFHQHIPEPYSDPRPNPFPLPYHCGWPMRLRPSGWQCRRCPSWLGVREPLPE
jgi:hypothetical protein